MLTLGGDKPEMDRRKGGHLFLYIKVSNTFGKLEKALP
jgi:hypothetical protein